ncbi:polymer-forming cytoskeletal protein [Marixanthomonas sp. SCSIO 43207]|uniref:bactofilin family protein n=1 Tax=Marixanthomonas sp. SCSIO 43207 TaxID=2779360 RepID=UPI001CA899D5|nr:polymer-forming cytoskeletal protein [Marixanthomonas sp. SCSIO 43207]UAB81899.1 polymer-forming cytoskeletal protein [Marixanthomonas sp. SCSIO 43207]
MFSEKKDKTAHDPSGAQNRINEGTTLQGDIVSKGFFRIDGTINGNVNTPSKVVVGKTGLINGTLTCENADIEGKFEGSLDVTGTLSLKSTAVIEGEVVVGKLAVEPGATFNASCVMKGSQKEAKKDNTPLAKEANNPKPSPYDRQQRAKKATEPLK